MRQEKIFALNRISKPINFFRFVILLCVILAAIVYVWLVVIHIDVCGYSMSNSLVFLYSF